MGLFQSLQQLIGSIIGARPSTDDQMVPVEVRDIIAHRINRDPMIDAAAYNQGIPSDVAEQPINRMSADNIISKNLQYLLDHSQDSAAPGPRGYYLPIKPLMTAPMIPQRPTLKKLESSVQPAPFNGAQNETVKPHIRQASIDPMELYNTLFKRRQV